MSSSVVSLAAVFVSSRNAHSQQINGGALRDETKTAAREASSSAATNLLFLFFEALFFHWPNNLATFLANQKTPGAGYNARS